MAVRPMLESLLLSILTLQQLSLLQSILQTILKLYERRILPTKQLPSFPPCNPHPAIRKLPNKATIPPIDSSVTSPTTGMGRPHAHGPSHSLAPLGSYSIDALRCVASTDTIPAVKGNMYRKPSMAVPVICTWACSTQCDGLLLHRTGKELPKGGI